MGVNPASATTSASVEFYFRPNAPEESSGSSGIPNDKFTMTGVVPEPSAAALAAIALLGALCRRGTRRS